MSYCYEKIITISPKLATLASGQILTHFLMIHRYTDTQIHTYTHTQTQRLAIYMADFILPCNKVKSGDITDHGQGQGMGHGSSPLKRARWYDYEWTWSLVGLVMMGKGHGHAHVMARHASIAVPVDKSYMGMGHLVN